MDSLRNAFTVALLVSFVMLLIYQVIMLVWTKRTTGTLPTVIIILRGVNIVFLTAGAILILLQVLK